MKPRSTKAKRKTIHTGTIDTTFSRLVRLRADYRCEKCGGCFEEGRGLECAHLFRRTWRSIRWHPLNAASLCSECHTWFDQHEHDSELWKREHIGDQAYDLMSQCRQVIAGFRLTQKKAIQRHQNAELKHMKALRAAGETGRIEFTVAPDIEALFDGGID